MISTQYSPKTWLGLSIFADSIICSSLQSWTDYSSVTYWHIPLKLSQIYNGLVINRQEITNGIIETMRINNINAQYVTIALPDDALTQTVTAEKSQEKPHYQTTHQLLCSTESLYYECQIPMTTLLSYTLLALKLPMHILSLTSHCSALLTGYRSLHGKNIDSPARATSYAKWRNDVLYAASMQSTSTHSTYTVIATESIGLFLQGKEVYEQFY